MFNDITRHRLDYSLLALMAAGYLMIVLTHQTAGHLIFIATLFFAGLYCLWGIWHHTHTKSLHARIVLEYFLVAALAVCIVSTLLL